MIYTVPKYFNHNHIDGFISKFEHMFKLKNGSKSGLILDCKSIQNISIIGVLILYKVMEYSLKNKYFVNPEIRISGIFSGAIEKYGFTKLMKNIINGDIPKLRIFEDLDVTVSDNLIIAPQPMIRGESINQETLRTIYAPKVASFYDNDLVSEMVLTCISEILLNFWKHAINDPQSILVAEGNKFKVEIACADTGNGIISTLLNGNSKYKGLSGERIMLEAVKRGTTSKPGTHHMGSGLWILDRIATLSGGMLHLHSEGISYKNQNGKINCSASSYWKGTIVYINIPIKRAVTMGEIVRSENMNFENIKLNIGS